MLATLLALVAPAHAKHHHQHRRCTTRRCGRLWWEHHRPRCVWISVGATLDPTAGQAPTWSDHGGFSFAELLEAGSNAGLRPDLTERLGLPRGSYGMPMETSIRIRARGHRRSFRIWKNDVGSGQGGDPHFKIDLHPGIANAIGFPGYGDVEVARC